MSQVSCETQEGRARKEEKGKLSAMTEEFSFPLHVHEGEGKITSLADHSYYIKSLLFEGRLNREGELRKGAYLNWPRDANFLSLL